MRVVLLESLHPDAERMLDAHVEVVRADSPDIDTATHLAADADAIITRGRGKLTAEVLRAGTHLKCVGRPGSGLDNIDVATATALGIPVIYAPDAVTETTAEHTIALMLTVSRQIHTWTSTVKSGGWAERATRPLTFDLSGRTLGIVGLGRIGTRVAEMASGLGMTVVYASRSSVDARWRRVLFDELLAEADVISLHTDLNDATLGLIGAAALSRMRVGAVLVNAARGAVVDEVAVAEALSSGRLRGYAADVMIEEPPPSDHPLLAFENVVLTPHSAALVEGAYRRMCLETAENVLRVLRGETPDVANWSNRGALTS